MENVIGIIGSKMLRTAIKNKVQNILSGNTKKKSSSGPHADRKDVHEAKNLVDILLCEKREY